MASQTKPDAKETEPSPAETVFGVAELLERIMQELPPLELIRLQRVSRAWAAGVRAASPAIREKLFLKAAEPEAAYTDISHNGVEWIKIKGRVSVKNVQKGQKHILETRLNEMLFEYVSQSGDAVEIDINELCFKNMVIVGCRLKTTGSDVSAFRDTSCAKMFLTQPPVKRVMLVGTGPESITYIKREDGVKWEDVWTKAFEKGCFHQRDDTLRYHSKFDNSPIWIGYRHSPTHGGHVMLLDFDSAAMNMYLRVRERRERLEIDET